MIYFGGILVLAILLKGLELGLEFDNNIARVNNTAAHLLLTIIAMHGGSERCTEFKRSCLAKFNKI